MPLSNSVIRRYTPPTCTLEVSALSSPLSQWMGKSVLKQLRFELRFDDPRLPEDQRVVIRGNRDQLEALCTTVTAYVQDFLHREPDQFWESYSDSNNATQTLNGTSTPQDIHNTSTRLSTLGKPYNNPIPKSDIYIEPSGYLSHNLFLGNLAPAPMGVIKLSLLQLFDLASALDEYSDDVLVLPNLNTTRRTTRIPNWAPIAAVVALALGLTPFTLQYANRARQNQQSQQTAAKQAQRSEIALSTPLPTVAATPGLLTPLNTLPSVAGLPTVPPSGTSTLPIPGAIPTPGANLTPGVPSVPNTTALAPGAIVPGSPGTSTQLPPNLRAPSTSQSGSNFNFPSNLPSGSTFTIPDANPRLPTTSTGKNPTPLTLPDSIALQPNITPNITQTTRSSNPKANATRGSTLSNQPSSSVLPPTTGLPPISALPTQFAQPEPRPATPRTTNRTAPGSSTNESGSLLSRLREARDDKGQIATASNRTGNTIFDTPQVSEARTALRARWQPPQGLKQTLEYSLLVGVDGSIERILPLGKAARDYIDRTGMPLIGEQFVSPNRNGQSVRIRAIFAPDGKVQTFPETD